MQRGPTRPSQRDNDLLTHICSPRGVCSEATAALMNEHFVNVKVDREERPDVDARYMLFVQATTGGGGWPMSVFLTPDLKRKLGGEGGICGSLIADEGRQPFSAAPIFPLRTLPTGSGSPDCWRCWQASNQRVSTPRTTHNHPLLGR